MSEDHTTDGDKTEIKKMFADLMSDPPEKKMNARKKRGASKIVSENMILAKLYEEGIIKQIGEKSYVIDVTSVNKRWGDDGKPNNTTKDIREILRRVGAGLEMAGNKVEVKSILLQ